MLECIPLLEVIKSGWKFGLDLSWINYAFSRLSSDSFQFSPDRIDIRTIQLRLE